MRTVSTSRCVNSGLSDNSSAFLERVSNFLFAVSSSISYWASLVHLAAVEQHLQKVKPSSQILLLFGEMRFDYTHGDLIIWVFFCFSFLSCHLTSVPVITDKHIQNLETDMFKLIFQTRILNLCSMSCL